MKNMIIIAALAAAALCFSACSLKTQGTVPEDGTTTDGPHCPAGEIPCGEFCIDPETDRLNCGACGIVCEVLEQCEGGECVCDDPYEECGGTCIDPRIDRRHCGGCNNQCDSLATCVDGECVCPSGLTDCNGKCVDTNTDSENCGGCGIVCEGGAFCNGRGRCALECDPPYTLCNPGGDSYCADLQNDPRNCNECGNECGPYDHAVPTCTGGVCGLSCDVGYGDANGSLEDGCECIITSPSEICDAIDNDCNGSVDEGFECILGETRDCTHAGTCTGGQMCQAGCTWGACENNTWECLTPSEQSSRDCGSNNCGIEYRTCRDDCMWGAWEECNLKSGHTCYTGVTQNQDCGDGDCGTQLRTCGNECTWLGWGDCALKSENACYQDQTQDCGNCGTETCTSSCQWGSCSGEGVCTPGATQGCGLCGSQTCTSSCNWGSCGGEGVCTPGATQNQDCGDCGTQSRNCGSDCQWGLWGSCGGEGVCTPNTTRGCGDCGTQTCTSSCAWGSCEDEGICTPGSSEACTPALPNENCIGERICNGSCSWGTCNVNCPVLTPDCCPVGCVDTQTDRNNCGTCGHFCFNIPYTFCNSGNCCKEPPNQDECES